MQRSQADRKRAYTALVAVFCVLFLCWGQQSTWVPTQCPQAQHGQHQTEAGTSLAECDSSSQLLQQAHLNILDSAAATSLFVGFLILVSIGLVTKASIQTPPARRRCRSHLVFCVFNE
ncbi:hypothetical protein [Pseudidiomarina sp.]|uniref:hypothetical protein n=1 Tax=Pseudidiomarina sp. TaxID=2081707 RepID=UPI003A979F1E